jgi:hypothetical protein
MILPIGVFNPTLIDTVLAVPSVDSWIYAVPDCPHHPREASNVVCPVAAWRLPILEAVFELAFKTASFELC